MQMRFAPRNLARILAPAVLVLLGASPEPVRTISTTQPARAEIPSTERRPVEEVLHGVRITDPYRWLEGDAHGNMTDEVAAWTEAQNAYTRQVLDNLPGRSQLEQRIRQLRQVRSVTAPQVRRNRYFYLKREGTESQAALYAREGVDGAPRLLVDPNRLDEQGLTALAWVEANPAGTLLAFGMYRAGDENAVCQVLDVDSGRWLADQISGKVTGVQWLADSSGFFYRRLRDIKNPYSAQICFHRLGQHARQDQVLFEQYREGPLATTWGPTAWINRQGSWMILSYWTSTKSNDLWAVDLDLWSRSGRFVTRQIIQGADARSSGPVAGDILYMHTTLDAPNGRVVAVDLNRPDRAHWRELIPMRGDAVITGISLARGLLAVTYQKDASSRIELFERDGTPLGPVSLPGIGTASLATEEDRSEAFLTFASFNHPPTIYHIDLRTGQQSLWDSSDVPVDPSAIEVHRAQYQSRDGTQVGMFLVHRKGLELNGDNPTILTGYGGFGIGITPSFNASIYPWLEAGGIFAVANLRGGNEGGESWHQAGILDRKQNVFDDFIAASAWLIDRKYTRPGRLAITGGSNGGLLTGAALTQRPDLYSAVVSKVPLLDMLRYDRFLMAKYWVPEYGSAENPEQFQFLLRYSPYHNVKPGTRYPAVLLTAGENDARVHPLHARKMAALLQSSSGSDLRQKPVLLWVDRDAGHGAGKPLNLRIREDVDSLLFIMWQVGMLK